MWPVTVAVEGDTDLPIVRKVLGHVGLNVGTAIDLGGKDALDLQLRAYLRAAAHSPWFILRDLDLDAQCAPELLASLAVPSDSTACVRIAVRAMEAWLLADAESISSFLGVRLALIPTDPDFEADPKGTIVALASRSRRPRIKRGMLPAPGSHRRVGPDFEARLIEFGESHWRPAVAARASPSLKRCLEALRRAQRNSWQRFQ